jgi:hypothetical protein
MEQEQIIVLPMPHKHFLVDVNSAAFSYSYAIVLMDPGHTPAEQPYFKINMYD